MKLFIAATACLSGTKAQSGDYVDREITSDYYNAYSDYDEFGNKKKKQKDNWFGAKFTTTATTGYLGLLFFANFIRKADEKYSVSELDVGNKFELI